MNNRTVFSRESDEWETPKDLYQTLDAEFRFTLDPCATAANAKCGNHYTAKDDGLTKNWGGQRVFCNPPYSKVKQWVQKCYEEAEKPGTVVVALLPSRTDTRWFHDYVLDRAEVRFIRGRLKFSGAQHNAPFPSMIVIWRSYK